MQNLYTVGIGVGAGYFISSIILKNFRWDKNIKGYRAFLQPVALSIYLILFGIIGLNFFV